MMKRLTNLLVFSLVLIASAGKTQPGINTFPLLGTTPDAADLFIMVDDTDTSTKNVTFGDMSAHAPAAHNHVELDITDLGAYLETVLASDINAEASADGYVLTSDGAGNAAWEAASGGGALNDLTDVTITTPSSNQVLSYNGSAWVNAAASGGGGGSGVVAPKVLIQEITLSTAGEFDFDNIPGDYDRLIIEGRIRSSVSDTSDGARIFFNADLTASNYHLQQMQASNGSLGAVEVSIPDAWSATGATAPAGAYADVQTTIEDYAGSNIKMTENRFVALRSTTEIVTGANATAHKTMTAPITRLRMRTDNHPTDGLTGTLRLYGERSITVEDSETITVKKAVPVTLSSGQYTMDLTDYQEGDRIVIEGQLRSDIAAVEDNVYLYFNSDTTDANYHYQQNVSAASNDYPTAQALPKVTGVTGSTATSGAYGTIQIVIEDYAGSNIKSARGTMFYTHTSGTTSVSGFVQMQHDSMTAALTSLTLKGAGGNLSGTLKAYIEKEGVLPVESAPRVLIQEITDPVSGEFDFTGIPQTYRRLVLKGHLRSAATGTNDVATIQFNALTTVGDYHSQTHVSLDGNFVHTGAEAADNTLGVVTAASTISGAHTTIESVIEGYATSILKQSITDYAGFDTSATAMRLGKTISGHKTSTAAITSLLIKADGGEDLSGTLTLYGEM